ncbi:MAG: hypothetical protein KGH64_00650 [Candidatus Micrarchaeota archaeon]|nr:hypothetical protein [Candidatus Micrarchaeota archaeon]
MFPTPSSRNHNRAVVRNAIWSQLTPSEKLAELDKRVYKGKTGVVAKRQRAKLAKQMRQ